MLSATDISLNICFILKYNYLLWRYVISIVFVCSDYKNDIILQMFYSLRLEYIYIPFKSDYQMANICCNNPPHLYRRYALRRNTHILYLLKISFHVSSNNILFYHFDKTGRYFCSMIFIVNIAKIKLRSSRTTFFL